MERSDALNTVKLYWPIDEGGPALREAIETLIPELKDSEDERIKKALIKAYQGYYPNDKWNKEFTFGQIVAWLEKQGDKAFSVERLFAEAGIKPAYKDGNSWYVLIGENIQEGICGFGETPKDAYVNFLKELWGKAFEQKPADKVEPKFHIEKGRWYVCTQSFTLNGNIVVAKGQTYESRNDNVISGEDARLFIDRHDGDASKYFRLWNIQDAKDGDVLLFEGNYNSIVLFQGISINGEGRINYHCKCNLGDYSFGIQGDVAYLGTIERDAEHYHPATKEQRDLLFKKMKESGYEWNAEKKELKKIEQTPAWSEEDEKMLNKCIKYASNIVPVKPTKESGLFVDFKRIPDEKAQGWLKLLKERYTWKPSDEQIKALENSTGADEEQSKALYSLLNDLKALCER